MFLVRCVLEFRCGWVGVVCTPLLLKSGAAPLHWWFPGVMEGLRWENCALLIRVQKAAPLMLISYLIEISAFTLIIILLSAIVGSIGGLNQTSIRKTLTYSTINHTGWILIALATSENLWLVYFRLQPVTRIPLQTNHTETPKRIEPRTIRPMW